MLTALLGLLTFASPAGAADARLLAAAARHAEAPGIRVWLSSRDLFRRGDRARVYYRTERDAFVTIFRVDTDGRIRILFPYTPDDDNYAYGATTYGVTTAGRNEAFVVDDDPGVGYVFGVASDEPFDYRALLYDGAWDVQLASGGRVHGDPLSSLEEMVQQLLPEGFVDFDTHLIPYYVERRYDYPRFVCYDCHAYTPWYSWNPYSAWCSRYTLVVWRDPWYYYPSYWYPTWYYGGTRVVYVQPGGTRADRGRFVFKDRTNSEPGIDYRDRRRTDDARRSAERFVRGSDVGGVGTVATPGRRTADAARRQPGTAQTPREGLTPRQAPDTRRRPATRPDDAPAPAGADRRRGITPTTDEPATVPAAEPVKRRDPSYWRPSSGERQQPASTERRSPGDDGPRAQPQPDRRPASEPSTTREPERRSPPPSAPAAKPESRPNGGGSPPSARGRGSTPSSRPSAPSARPSAPSARPSSPPSGGSRPASPGLVRRRPS
jgi:hypothetical protein